MKSVGQEFKEFILRGNVVDLAIAVVIGAAFGAVVTAVVEDLITPLIAAIGGQPDFSALTFTINDSEFKYGDFINKVISFLVIAAVVFFLIVKPLNVLIERTKKAPVTVDPSTKKCPYCYSEIPLEATRCGYCTSQLSGASAA
jgi:large conductance mechanosensitive channel